MNQNHSSSPVNVFELVTNPTNVFTPLFNICIHVCAALQENIHICSVSLVGNIFLCFFSLIIFLHICAALQVNIYICLVSLFSILLAQHRPPLTTASMKTSHGIIFLETLCELFSSEHPGPLGRKS